MRDAEGKEREKGKEMKREERAKGKKEQRKKVRQHEKTAWSVRMVASSPRYLFSSSIPRFLPCDLTVDFPSFALLPFR